MEIVNTVFQILFVAVMSIGILGLPLYFYLAFRRKRIIEESKENKDIKDNTAEE